VSLAARYTDPDRMRTWRRWVDQTIADSRQTGGQPATFAREAYKIVVDIDRGELDKRWVKADLPVHADVRDVLAALNRKLGNTPLPSRVSWIARTMGWKAQYPVVQPEYHQQTGSVNAYVFIKTLSDALPEGAIIIPDQGGNLTWTMQAFEMKPRQELFSAFGNSPMGYALPASIGASFARPGQDIVCIDGDGGFQMNIQELQTVMHNQLPIKMFILNNRSYGIIKQFQEIYFQGRYIGTSAESGYTAPDFPKVAQAYGIPAIRIDSHQELQEKLAQALATPGPILIDVRLAEDQKLIPKLGAVKIGDRYISKPIEDMLPLLPREEFYSNMIVKPLEEEARDKSQEIN